MGHYVMFLALTLLTLNAESLTAQNTACSIDRCQCSPNPNWMYPDVNCFVSSITTSDATMAALPADIQSLILSCGSSQSRSFLSSGIFEKFPQLRSLKIDQCNISVLTANSFKGLASLENLSISDSVLPLMDTDTFLHLQDLRFLSIVLCNLSSLPDISHLKSLQNLNVSYNNLHLIEFETSASTDNITQAGYLHNLTILDLSYNNFSSVPLGLITRTPHLQQLYLIGLPLRELCIHTNIHLEDLVILDAKESPLVVVNLPGLEFSTGIKALRLEGTGRPVHLPALSHLTSLQELALNNLAINNTIWQKLNSSLLTGLNLASNNLATIEVSYFPSLLFLDVSINKISYLNDSTFDNQTNLANINVSHNSIQDLPVNIFQKSSNIKTLDLSYNNISMLKSGVFRGLNQLYYLDLSNNFISSLPYDFSRDMSSMRSLYIRNNSIKFLPKLSHMSALTSLDLGYNQLSYILPNDLSGLANLEALFVNHNRLKILPPNLLSECPKLLLAWLNNNRISDLGTFGAHPNLKVLRLDYNQIADFVTESPLVRLQRLEYLFLDSNMLTTLNYNIFPPSLHIIFLNNNYFEYLYSTSFSYLPNLAYVSLANNKRILSMPSSTVNVFKDSSPKPTFNIEKNVFYCDCNLSYLKVISEDKRSNRVFNIYYPQFDGIDNTKCYIPFEGGTIRDFTSVPLSHFACVYNETWTDGICSHCSNISNCDCSLSCPSECTCYYGGSGFRKIYIHIICSSKNIDRIPKGIPQRTGVLYLDGNKFNHLSKQDFAHLQHTEDIYLNSSYIKSIDDRTFENISALISLFLNDNHLTSIDDNFFGRLTSVRQIYLHNNLIDIISSEAFSELSSVQTITLHNNRLMFLKAALKIPHPMSITLAGNPWSCDCKVSKVIIRTFYEIKDSLADFERMCCSFHDNSFLGDLESRGTMPSSADINESFTAHNPAISTGDKHTLFSSEDYTPIVSEHSSGCLPLLHFSYEDHCTRAASNWTVSRSTTSSGFHPGFISLVVITMFLLLVAAAVVVVLVKRQELQAWLFVKLGVRILDKKVHMDKEDAAQKTFDAFISYSSKDEEFVAASLVPTLENGDRKYRLCVHYRDFPVGRNITDTIHRAIQNSSRTILLLSTNFLSSEWCRYEFQTAHHHILREGSHRLIVVILGDVPEEMLDPDLKVHLQSKTYLKYGDRWFWEKLFFAMPCIKGREINNDDQRADILQRMQVLARDEFVDEQINIQGEEGHTPEVTGQTLNNFPERLNNGHVLQTEGGNTEIQDDVLINVRMQLAPHVNFGFLNVDNIVDEDLEKTADDRV